MFNKINTKYLFIVFFALLALVLLTIPVSNKKKNRSFRSELTSFEITNVTKFIIFPKSGGDQITFIKKDNNWWVSDKEGEYNADDDQVKNMLFTLSGLKAKRLAGKGKESWKKYELNDSLGTRIEVLNDKKVLADLYVGKFSYTQSAQPVNPYQGPQGVMTSFVRLTNEKEVYAVDGFLSMQFNRQLKDFRNSNVLQLQKDRLEKISFSYPDQSFSLTNNGKAWMIDGLSTDSTKVADYLSGISHLRSSDFNSKPAGAPNYSLKFAGDNGTEIAVINAYYSDSTNIVIESSINTDTYFDGKKDDLFTKLFREKSEFMIQ